MDIFNFSKVACYFYSFFFIVEDKIQKSITRLKKRMREPSNFTEHLKLLKKKLDRKSVYGYKEDKNPRELLGRSAGQMMIKCVKRGGFYTKFLIRV